MPDPVKKFGDARLAEKVIEAFAEGPVGSSTDMWTNNPITELHLDPEECSELGIDKKQCVALQNVLNYTSPEPLEHNAPITDSEKALLSQNGFSQEFTQALAGPDGKRVLQARVKWLQEHVTKRIFWGYGYLDRLDMVLELALIGPAAKSALPSLIKIGSGGDGREERETIRAILNIEPDEFGRLYYLSRMCTDSDKGLDTLIAGLDSMSLDTRNCSHEAIRATGKGGQRAARILMRQYRQDLEQYRQDWNEKHELNHMTHEAFNRMEQSFQTLTAIALSEPTEEILNFLEEIAQQQPFTSRHSIQICSFLVSLGPAAIPTRLRLLLNEELKGNVGYYLGVGKEAPPYLFSALEHPNQKIVREVLGIITEHKIKAPSDNHLVKLIFLLKDPSPEIRKAATQVLAVQGIAAKNALPLLVAMRLNDPEESCRVKAKEAMEKIEEGVL